MGSDNDINHPLLCHVACTVVRHAVQAVSVDEWKTKRKRTILGGKKAFGRWQKTFIGFLITLSPSFLSIPISNAIIRNDHCIISNIQIKRFIPMRSIILFIKWKLFKLKNNSISAIFCALEYFFALYECS